MRNLFLEKEKKKNLIQEKIENLVIQKKGY